MFTRFAGTPLGLIGVALVTTGTAMIHVPSGMIVAGVGALYVSWRAQVGTDTGSEG